jgi:Bestrophin, RFP-TM, chloride channel
VLKLLWRDLLVFLAIFFLIHILYMTVLDKESQKIFESLHLYCVEYENAFPISFVLGFFVATVSTRWWDQWMVIPWPYSVAVYVSSTLHGYDEMGRAMRRTIMRYVCEYRLLVDSTQINIVFVYCRSLAHHGSASLIETRQGKIPQNG